MARPKREVVEQLEPQKPKRRRTPVDGARDILTVMNKDPNYVYRLVLSDIPGRVQYLTDRGYELVLDDGTTQVGMPMVDKGSNLNSVITVHAGGGKKYVLMRILREWYDEDQKAKQDKVAALEAAMLSEVKSGRIPGGMGQPGYGTLDISRGKP